MPDRRQHTKLSKSILGELSLGEPFQVLLDAHQGELGPRHRAIDHSMDRIGNLAKLYGQVGTAEILIHLMADYGLVREWSSGRGNRVFSRRNSGYFDLRKLDGTKVLARAKAKELKLLERGGTLLMDRRK